MQAIDHVKAVRRLAYDAGWAFLEVGGLRKPGTVRGAMPRPVEVGRVPWRLLGALSAVRIGRQGVWLAWRTYRFTAWDAPLHPAKACCASGHHVNPESAYR